MGAGGEAGGGYPPAGGGCVGSGPPGGVGTDGSEGGTVGGAGGDPGVTVCPTSAGTLVSTSRSPALSSSQSSPVLIPVYVCPLAWAAITSRAIMLRPVESIGKCVPMNSISPVGVFVI